VTGRAQRSEGSLITANNESSLLTTITQVDPVWVRFSLAESDFQSIRGNERDAKVQLVAADGEIAADNGAQLRREQRRREGGRGTDARRLRQPGPQVAAGPVPQGAHPRGRAVGDAGAAIGAAADEQSRMVLVVGPEGKAVAKPVKTASWIGADAVITSGLADGDLVIVDNLSKVRRGPAGQA
jgi:membrane fusion protein (multidrug efflux system)